MAARTWTPEQRQQQAEAIMRWKPWRHSTGPRSAEGKVRVSLNAYRGGEWRKLRLAVTLLNETMREQKEWLGDLCGASK